jgi:hypothetical protein
MNHLTALDQIRDHQAHRRLTYLCREDNPDTQQRDGYRGLAIKIASGEPIGQRIDPTAPPPPAMPCCGGDLSYPDP